ncbi:cyclic nucleotide-binding domain-containing protein [Indioceanicola profundi]|uniref:cyclic nucleotide-binding domain-containing protein n=1 Tax=Indioceanicola profundi TaxID=2220096 RepID=UPI000E6A9C8B|nr:cyclic nucleotide-binding domain-containing protein [Indioceanicola profundi]
MDLPFYQVLQEAGEPIRHVYFVEQGMISQLVQLEGGQEQEVGLLGREGLVGLVAGMGAETSFTASMMQVPGSALRLPVVELRQEMAQGGGLQILRQQQQASIQ